MCPKEIELLQRISEVPLTKTGKMNLNVTLRDLWRSKKAFVSKDQCRNVYQPDANVNAATFETHKKHTI